MENWMIWVWVIQTALGFWFYRSFSLKERRKFEGVVGDFVLSAIIVFNLVLFLLFAFILIDEFLFRAKNLKTSQYQMGYDDAKESIENGENAVELLNQALSSLTRDEYDKGWINACKQKINEQL